MPINESTSMHFSAMSGSLVPRLSGYNYTYPAGEPGNKACHLGSLQLYITPAHHAVAIWEVGVVNRCG